ncbi:MAG: hypothetical protein P4L74_05040 [Candidatus Doudnabacteria bacterium]|nr:hypothetical protein [Candidatus Doudnabacteria bacterium]
MPQEELIGTIAQYNDTNGLAYITLIEEVSIGEKIHIKGGDDNFTQEVLALQVSGSDVQVAYKGDLVAIRMVLPAKASDKVFAYV